MDGWMDLSRQRSDRSRLFRENPIPPFCKKGRAINLRNLLLLCLHALFNLALAQSNELVGSDRSDDGAYMTRIFNKELRRSASRSAGGRLECAPAL